MNKICLFGPPVGLKTLPAHFALRRLAMFLTTLIALLWITLLPSHATLPTGWSGADLGGATGGADDYTSGTFTIAGSGTGFGNSTKNDQMHFTYANVSGDFKLTAHVVGFNGAKGSEVGLAVRANAVSGTCSAGAVAFEPAMGSGLNPNAFYMYDRCAEPNAYWPYWSSSATSRITTPCWLQLIRSGNDFAVYKSDNGTEWAQVQSSSGGAFTVSGSVAIGLFVASGTSTSTATASFDNVSLVTSPVTDYESSWVGNTLSRKSTSYVSGAGRSIWVSPDGTCYVTNNSDEAGQAGKIYKSGTVCGAFTLSAAGSNEGCITSDGTSLYYWGAYNPGHFGIYQTDMKGSNIGYRPIFCQTALTKGSGVAVSNGQIFISSLDTNQVIVASGTTNTLGLAANQLNKVVTQPIDVSGVANPAPQAVYQSQFVGNPVLYIPIASGTYTVRMHFAELDSGTNVLPGYRLMKVVAGNQSITNYDIVASSGTNFKAAVATLSNVVVTNGTMAAYTQWSGGTVSPRWSVLNGVEILDQTGTTQIKAVNAGGAATGSWISTINEIPGRTFSFTRPGPITVDKRGNLWIIQEGAPYPACQQFVTTSGSAAIKCYNANGQQLLDSSNRPIQMTDFVNPTAICYDSVNDRLLVAEDGPNQNIRIYTGLVSGTAPAIPACTGTFGQSVFSGPTPGLANDPAAGGEARFYALCGLGLDGSGNIYVSMNGSLKAFTPSGSLIWKLEGMEFCNTGDFDHSVDGPDLWTPQHHYTMNYSGTTPGGEWTLKSYLWNDFVWGPEPGAVASCVVYRKINGTPLMFTANQGSVGSLRAYRFVGEQIVPCGMLGITGTTNNTNLWVDSNGNGIMESSEITPTNFGSYGIYGSFDVADNGDVYNAFGYYPTRAPYIAKLVFGGFNSYGCPMYTAGSATPVPSNSGFGGGGLYPRVRYAGSTASGTDTLFIMAATHPLAGGTTGGGTQYNYGATLACYDNWNSSPTLRFSRVLPDPDNNANLTYGQNYANVSAPFYYMSLDVANGVSFASELWGGIHVIDKSGNPITKIIPGPELDGLCGYEDQCIGTRAHYNPTTQEYYICQENSGYQERMNFYRWSPVTTLLDTSFQDGINPFVLSGTTTGGSMSVVSFNGGNAIQMQDASVNGENSATTFNWTLNSSHPLVARINQVLTGTTPATFSFGFDVKRTSASTKPVLSNISAYLQASPNDGNPPANGAGRDLWWTTRAIFGTLPDYQSGNYIQIDEATFPRGYDGVNPWRGYSFTVTPNGTGQKINNLTIIFTNRADTNGTPEAYLVNRIFVDEVKDY